MGRFKEADSLLAPTSPPNAPLDITAKRGILQGRTFCRLGKTPDSEAAFDSTERLLPPENRVLRAELAFARGKCASLSGQARARSYYQQSVDLAQGYDNFLEARGLVDVGNISLHEGQYPEAIGEFEEVLQLTDSALLRGRALGDIGFGYSQLGDWRRAISYSEQAAKIAEDTHSNEALEKWLIDLGKAHFALWEFFGAEEAKADYLKALAIAQHLQDRDNAALCFHNLALIALRTNDPNSAENYVNEGKALNSDRERLHFELDIADIASARKQFSLAERLFRALLVQTGHDALVHSIVQQNLGRVYWNENKIGQADDMFRAGIATAERALERLKRPEYRMAFMDQHVFYDPYIQFLVAQKKRIDALKIVERSRAQVLAAGLESGKVRDPSVTIAGLKALSKRRRQTILCFSMTDEKTFLWIISESLFELRELPGHRDLSKGIIGFNQEVQAHANIENSPAAATAYESLIQPAAELIPKGSSVVVIPSKLLSMVNFEALVVPGPKPHYWIDDASVEVAGSLALLSKTPSRQPAFPGAKELLALGAPVEATKDYPILQHAPEEIQRVQSHFPPAKTTVIAGQEATPQAYRTSNPGRYRFIHLDTHGVSSDMNPLESAIILSPGSDNAYKLTADQIKDVPLHADLVTISACYGSGTRWYQGEGLVGLAWAFMRAGAHQVVGALWEVDEASSPQLMDDFYSELTQGKSAAEALRDAKLKMLHSNTFYRHPYYWASLQLYTGS